MPIKQEPLNITDKGRKNLRLLAEKLSRFDDEKYYFDMGTYTVDTYKLSDKQKHSDEFICQAPSCALGWAAYWEIAGKKDSDKDFIDYCRKLLDIKRLPQGDLIKVHEWFFGGQWCVTYRQTQPQAIQRAQRLAVIDRINFTLMTSTILATCVGLSEDQMDYVKYVLAYTKEQ